MHQSNFVLLCLLIKLLFHILLKIQVAEKTINEALTLKCIAGGGALGPMISFLANPVETRKDFSALFLVIA